jgi:hypothetical protein
LSDLRNFKEEVNMSRKRAVFDLVICILLISSLVALAHREYKPVPLQHTTHNQFASEAEEQEFVNKWYAATNDTYFSNKLPKDTKIEIHEIPPDVHADFTIAQTTPLGNGQYIIEIDPRFNNSGDAEGLSLDHEICHIYLLQQNGDGDGAHGVRFQNCMKRLAAEGAFQEVW